MSIASEITRLQTAKANLKTSIEAKGVAVPASATLDAYPAYVDAISGGGGSNFRSGIYSQGGYIYISPDPGAGGVGASTFIYLSKV